MDGVANFEYTPTYSTRDERLGLTIKQGTGPSDPIFFNSSAQYDKLGQVEWLQLAGYGGGPTQKADFSYDLAGQTTQIQRTQNTTSAARTNFGYDNQGRLSSLAHQQPSTSAK